MARLSIEATKKKTREKQDWSRWKPASAALAALAIGCDPVAASDSSCYTVQADAGASCFCNSDGGVNAGMFDDAGSCLPVPPAPSAPTCPADPNPACASQSVTTSLNLDGGASSTL